MSYYSSPKKYQIRTGKNFSENHPCIHVTGSVTGMINLGFWEKGHDKVRKGSWIYNMSLPDSCFIRG